MIALPVLPPRAPGLIHQLRRERHDIDLGLVQQQVKFAPALVALPRFDYNRRFQSVDSRYQAYRIACDAIDEAFTPGSFSKMATMADVSITIWITPANRARQSR